MHGANPDIRDSVGHGHTALAWFFDNPLNARCVYALELLLQVRSNQWRIQSFPEEPTNMQFGVFSAENCMNMYKKN